MRFPPQAKGWLICLPAHMALCCGFAGWNRGTDPQLRLYSLFSQYDPSSASPLFLLRSVWFIRNRDFPISLKFSETSLSLHYLKLHEGFNDMASNYLPPFTKCAVNVQRTGLSFINHNWYSTWPWVVKGHHFVLVGGMALTRCPPNNSVQRTSRFIKRKFASLSSWSWCRAGECVVLIVFSVVTLLPHLAHIILGNTHTHAFVVRPITYIYKERLPIAASCPQWRNENETLYN